MPKTWRGRMSLLSRSKVTTAMISRYLLLLSVVLSSGLGDARPIAKGGYEFVLPTDAQSVVRDKVGSTDQILFKVQRRYPAFAFSEETVGRLMKDGWKKCASSAEEWSSFDDRASGSSTRVHQRVLHLKKADQVMLLIGRYTSPAARDGAGVGATLPATEEQVANVIGVRGSPTELSEALKIFDARC